MSSPSMDGPRRAAHSAPDTRLPDGYVFVRDLTRAGAPESLIEAEVGGRKVALRIARAGTSSESRAELAVLSIAEHAGLAAFVDHGSLPGGGAWVAREWIEGRDLASWSNGRRADEIGRMVARLCVALDALHERGFVHGDLKPGNVIVADGERPVLTDFGLARRSGLASRDASGTPFGVAPEVLLGHAADARADLFALGVMLHELLLRRRPSAREFYGRFPAFDFFDATRTRADELPEWARDVVTDLVERQPDRRPASAAQVGRTLAGRLGPSDLFRAPRGIVRWPIAQGRETWIESWLALDSHFDWLRCGERESPRPLLDQLALRAALRGARVQRIDLRERAEQLRDAAELDRWVVATCDAYAGSTLFAALESGDAWPLHVLDQLAREVCRRSDIGLVVAASASIASPELAWRALDVPAIGAREIEPFLAAILEPGEDPERIGEFAAALAEASSGSAVMLDELLAECARQGAFLSGGEKLRLRPGPLLAPARRGTSEIDGAIEGSLATMLAALHVRGGDALADEIAAVAQIDRREFGGAMRSALERRWISIDGARVRSIAATADAIELAEPRWRELHARRAAQLERAGAKPCDVLPHRFRAGLASARDVVAECERLRDVGCPELALHLTEAVSAQAAQARIAIDESVVAERALAWIALGQPDRALEAIAPFPQGSAAAERVRGQVATANHEYAKAIEHFERAREIDPHDGGVATLAKLRSCYELQRDRELVESVGELASHSEAMQPRVWANVLALEAMSRFRLGEVERARQSLARFAEDARASGDLVREAALRINLATVERRAGALPSSVQQFERAIELYDRAGVVTGLAQARAMLGGALREAGELARAQPLLQSALAIRERLGDEVGASAIRGMLGLLLAGRGHAHAAVEELERSASALRATQRRRDALVLDAHAAEMRARLGSARDGNSATEAERSGEGDPRILIAMARAQWLRGDDANALELAERAGALASSLGLAAFAAEVAFLACAMRGEAFDGPDESAPLIAEDARALALLSRSPFDFEGAQQLARELAERGRDDRAARLWIAIAARSPNSADVRSIRARADELFARCAAGSSESETQSLRRSLLGMPDPWPEDLTAFDMRRSSSEEDEMEVVRLLEINHRLVAQEDLRSLLGTIVEQALSVSGAQRGFLILEERGELAVDTAMDSRRGGIDSPDVEVSGSVLREALERMQPVRISNAVDDPLLGAAPSVVALQLRSILCIPFEIEKGLRGVIYVDHRLREGAFDTRAERMLTLLADQAALAIGQVRRLDEIRRLNRELGRQIAHKESDLRVAKATLRAAGLPAPTSGLVGTAPVMQKLRALIERAAQTKLAVLVTGPSGSGKELAARALHELGPRSNGPFVSENCAALPNSLIEAELFGARRGAYTGSERDREGLFERAHGGTLFLDEIGELPLDLQAKLLRVIETGEVRRLGDDELRKVDFRLVAATNRDLAREVREGRFREDLLYRLDALRIVTPALAQRTEDIPALIDHCLRLQAAPGEAPRKISPAVVTRLAKRDWPGNVRELFNEVSRLAVLSDGDISDSELVRDAAHWPVEIAAESGELLSLDELERRAILHALKVSAGDKRKAAEMLGISRAKIYQRLKDWGEAEQGEAKE